MLKIITIIGARPQFIKHAPISKVINEYNKKRQNYLKDIIIHTGQHYDYKMSKVFFDQLGIPEPDYNLEIGSGSHGFQTGEMVKKIESVLINEKPDWVLIYGDTNSTLAGALAASKIHIPIAHVEAGLRSYNKYMAEEINRILSDHVSTILFCTSRQAIKNLYREGIKNIVNEGNLIPLKYKLKKQNTITDQNNPMIINIGDVMYDVLLYSIDIAENKSDILRKYNLTDKKYYLQTVHRAENTDNKEQFEKIIKFVNQNSLDIPVIFPMHPRTKKVYKNIKLKYKSNIKIIDPLGYFDIIKLLKHSELLFTDSGGMQKEAFWLKVPCITMRNETEWTETIESGWNILYKDYKGNHNIIDKKQNIYGDGSASYRIINSIFDNK